MEGGLPNYFKTIEGNRPTIDNYNDAYNSSFSLYLDFLYSYGLDKSKIWDTLDRKRMRNEKQRKEYVHASLQSESGYKRWILKEEEAWF